MITPGRYTIRNVASNFYLGLQLPLGLSSAVITLPPEDSSPDYGLVWTFDPSGPKGRFKILSDSAGTNTGMTGDEIFAYFHNEKEPYDWTLKKHDSIPDAYMILHRVTGKVWYIQNAEPSCPHDVAVLSSAKSVADENCLFVIEPYEGVKRHAVTSSSRSRSQS